MAYKNKEEQKDYQRKWKAARRDAWLSEHGPCCRCGSTLNLEIDHVDSSTKVSHKVWSWSIERRDAELAKCQVLCRVCHLQKSRDAGEQPQARRHGTDSMYSAGKCRCSLGRRFRFKSEHMKTRIKMRMMPGDVSKKTKAAMLEGRHKDPKRAKSFKKEVLSRERAVLRERLKKELADLES